MPIVWLIWEATVTLESRWGEGRMDFLTLCFAIPLGLLEVNALGKPGRLPEAFDWVAQVIDHVADSSSSIRDPSSPTVANRSSWRI